MYLVSDHGISGIMPSEVSIIRNKWTFINIHILFLIMDTSSGIIPHLICLLSKHYGK